MSRRKGRVGALSPQTYFPGTGDHLEDPVDGIVWVCAKSNSYSDPHSGDKFRYALLIGRMHDSDESIPIAIHDSDEREWLAEIRTIRRRLQGSDDFRDYDWNEATNTWRQRIPE